MSERKRAGDVFLLNPNEIIFEEGFNCRQNYTGIEELAQSMQEQGQVNPIQVYRVRKGDNKGKFLVRVGHRRTLASQLIAESDSGFLVKALMMKSNDPVENLLLQFNSQTEVPLNNIEKGNLIMKLRETKALSDTDIQSKLGISSPQMYLLIQQASTTPAVQEAIANDMISGSTVNNIIRAVKKDKGEIDYKEVEIQVMELVSKAQSSEEVKGKKGKKVTNANLDKVSSFTSKLNELVKLIEFEEIGNKEARAFLKIAKQLKNKETSVQDILSSFE